MLSDPNKTKETSVIQAYHTRRTRACYSNLQLSHMISICNQFIMSVGLLHALIHLEW